MTHSCQRSCHYPEPYPHGRLRCWHILTENELPPFWTLPAGPELWLWTVTTRAMLPLLYARHPRSWHVALTDYHVNCVAAILWLTPGTRVVTLTYYCPPAVPTTAPCLLGPSHHCNFSSQGMWHCCNPLTLTSWIRSGNPLKPRYWFYRTSAHTLILDTSATVIANAPVHQDPGTAVVPHMPDARILAPILLCGFWASACQPILQERSPWI